MRKRFSLIVYSTFALVCLLCFWNWGKHIPKASQITASALGGYYEDAFLLELSVPEEGQIYYTTDGSCPTAQSKRYTDGIFISNRSSEPNIYNAVPTVVSDWKNYTPDPSPVAKGTVIRAIFINRWGKESDIFTQTYFVGLEPPSEGYTLSLIFEEDDVFGADGIHVTGTDYDLWYLSGQHGSAPSSNFTVKTKVPAIAELLDSSGDTMLQSIAFRVHGSSSVVNPKKRLALFAESEPGSPDVFSANIFPGAETHSVMLKDSIIDLLVPDLVQDRSVSIQRNVPVRVFFNGEYWYDTYMLERFDDEYFQSYYGVENTILVKDGDQEVPSDRRLSTYYDDFMDWIEESDFSKQAQWEQLQERMDVQSYIDFFCINHYLCNLDWSEVSNCVLWCSATDDGLKYRDMRWRWCIYDIDNLPDAAEHFGYDQIARINTFTARTPWINTQTNEQSLYLALRANPQFCQQFVLSFMDIVNNNFSPDKTEAVLQKHPDIPDWMNAFFQDRSTYVVQHLAEEFQLTGTLETATLTCSDPQMGTVIVNTSLIDLNDGTWSGQYFTDYPITVTANANDGYVFVGWKGDVQDTKETITVSMEGGISLEAVFAETP